MLRTSQPSEASGRSILLAESIPANCSLYETPTSSQAQANAASVRHQPGFSTEVNSDELTSAQVMRHALPGQITMFLAFFGGFR